MLNFQAGIRIGKIAVVLLACSGLLRAEEKAEEEAVHSFPETVVIGNGGKEYSLVQTGTAERNILFIKVYQMAHYMEGADVGGGEVPSEDELLNGSQAKHIQMKFIRDLPYEKIRAELKKTMLRNAKQEWIENSKSEIVTFLEAINRDALKGDILTLSWFPGGKLVAAFNGEQALAIENADFARMIWSIWFGAKPVVRRDDLLAAFQGGGQA